MMSTFPVGKMPDVPSPLSLIRRHRTPHGYISTAFHVGLLELGMADPIGNKIIEALSVNWTKDGQQFFWIGADIVAVALASKVPLCRMSDIKLPFNSFTFLLPFGAFRTSDGNISSITFHKYESEYTIVSFIIKDEGGQLVQLEGVHSGTSCNDAVDENSRNFIDLNSKNEVHCKIGAMINRLMINIIAIMNERPQYVEPSNAGPRNRKARTQEPMWWEPRWVGRAYTAKREMPTGTHASPRMHWRRGHWRAQRYGAELRESRQLWIEPVLVSAPEPEPVA